MRILDSTVLHEVEYAAGNLAVTFVGGRCYRYRGVPRHLYDDLLAAPSKGKFFNEAIRDRFTFAEITAGRTIGRPGPAR